MTVLTTKRSVACDTGVNPPVANCKVDKSKIAGKDSFRPRGGGLGLIYNHGQGCVEITCWLFVHRDGYQRKMFILF